MALVMTPIYTQTVGAGGAATMTFNNIPQVYTDLMLYISARTTAAVTSTDVFGFFNNDTGAANTYSGSRLYGQGSSVGTDRQSNTNVMRWGDAVGTSATSNTFTSTQIYIPNYSTASYKQIAVDSVSESNVATGYYLYLNAMLWYPSTPQAITKISFGPLSGSFAQYTTASLYGIIRSGA